MKKITTIGIIIVTIFTISCSRKNYTMKDISGKYINSGFESYRCIIFDTNSTFQYNWQGGLIYGKTSGKWRLEKNNIILNSEFQPSKEKQKKSFLRNASLSGNCDSLYLKILDERLEAIPFATCIISFENKDITGKAADFDGYCMLDWEKGMTLKIANIGYEPIKVIIPDSVNYLEFVLAASNDPGFYKYFTEYKVKIQKNHNLLFEKYDHKIWRLFHGFNTRLILYKKEALVKDNFEKNLEIHKITKKEEYPGENDFYIIESIGELQIRKRDNKIKKTNIIISDNFGKIYYQKETSDEKTLITTLKKGTYKLKILYDGKTINRIVEIF